MRMTMLQFSVPGIAAEAVNVRQLEASARRTGVSVVQLTYRFAYRESRDGTVYRCRITCSAQMAVYLIEQLRVTESLAVERGESDLAAACSRGIRETYTALMAPHQGQRRGRAADRRAMGLDTGRGQE